MRSISMYKKQFWLYAMNTVFENFYSAYTPVIAKSMILFRQNGWPAYTPGRLIHRQIWYTQNIAR